MAPGLIWRTSYAFLFPAFRSWKKAKRLSQMGFFGGGRRREASGVSKRVGGKKEKLRRF